MFERWYPPSRCTESTETNRGTRCSHALTTEVFVRIVWEGEEEHRGATGMKDVSLPVCHKSCVLLCDRLADRASSVSWGTRRLLLQSHIFLRCSSYFLKQREGEGSHWFGVLEQTYSSLIRLLVSAEVYGLCRAESPQSTIRTKRITKTCYTWWTHSAASDELPKTFV